MSIYRPKLETTVDPNDEFRRLVRACPFTRRQVAILLRKSVPTINAYMSPRTSKKWRRVHPATIRELRGLLMKQESVLLESIKKLQANRNARENYHKKRREERRAARRLEKKLTG